MMLFSGVIKIAHGQQVAATLNGKLGYPEGLITPIGVLELACTIVYAIPQTSMLGLLLLTGYLGGAMAAELRIGSPVGYSAAFILTVTWVGPNPTKAPSRYTL